MKPLSGAGSGHSGPIPFRMPTVLPVCGGCGERGIHGTPEECLVQLRRAVAVAKGQVAAVAAAMPQMPVVQRVAEGVSGWS